ncbi:MAG: TrmH family RNA methyltransferase [Sporichthyaceae bacterium]
MPDVLDVLDAADPRLTDYARLVDVGHRVRREPADGVFIAEGVLTLDRALAAGYRPRSLLLAPNRVEAVPDQIAAIAAAGAPVYVAPPDVLENLTGYRVHRGLLAAMDRRPLPALADVLRGARRIAVLEDIADHTNVGAAIRNAAAFGIDAVLVTPSCADPLYRRAIRTSMGTVFQVPWTRLREWPADIAHLHDAGFHTVALTPDGAGDLRAVAAAGHRRLALLLGSEGEGLRPGTLTAARTTARIPMAGGVDSLNIAAAAAVAFFATQ